MEICVRDEDNVIMQYGHNIGEREGCTIYDISAEEAELLRELMAKGPARVIFTDDGDFVAE